MSEIKKQSIAQTPGAPAKTATVKSAAPASSLFSKDNYKWMAIGGIIIILGMVLMSGGKNQDANTFDPAVVYSTTRVTIAPILIILGLLVEVYAIFRKSGREADA